MSSETTKPKRWITTIRLRLTLWGMVTTLAVCLSLCAVLYLGVYYSLLREVDAFLQEEVRELGAKVREHREDLKAAEAAVRLELGNRTRGDLSFRLYASDGTVLLTSVPSSVVVDAPGLPRGQSDSSSEPYFETVRIPAVRHRVRTCTAPLKMEGERVYMAQAAYSMQRTEHSMAMLRRIIAGVLSCGAVLALGAGWIQTQRSLRPVGMMAAMARHIGTSRLGERLPRSGTGDELDQLAETLNGMLDRIEGHVNQMRQFTADASHELRSPLAALRGLAEVTLSQPRTEAELRQVIESCNEQYERLQRLVEGLLLLAQADAGRVSLKVAPVSLNDVVSDVADLYRVLAEEAGVAMDVETLPTVEVVGDGGRLREMIGNLVHNAIKYTSSPGRVDVSMKVLDGRAEISIVDTGIGISAEDLPRVFDRFYRADKARASAGTGLGLAISRWIARAHGGDVRLSSAVSKGTTVTVILPVSSVSAA